MIVNKEVLSRIASKWDSKEGMFSAQVSNIVGQWCVDYFDKYKKAPGKQIVALYEAWAEDHPDKETTKLVDMLLTSLSGQYARLAKEVNPDLIIDAAGVLFNKVKLTKHKDAVEGDLENGDVKKALERFNKFRPVEMGGGEWVDILRDQSAIQRAFEDKRDPLIEYPAGAGSFFGQALERDGFVAVQGAEKRGKSYWLLDFAWRAMQQHRRVAFFEAGDLSQSQAMRRFMSRAAKRPVRATPKNRPGLKIPTKFTVEGEDVMVEYDERRWDKPLTWQEGVKACEKVIQSVKSNESLLRLSVHANSSISVNGIRSYIDKWDKDDWLPDVVVIDYADILAPISGVADTRDQINTTWKLLRRLSQDLHCLVITATQADAGSYEVDTQSRKNFSEDKRKYAHVTGMFGINQSSTEKEQGIQRLNWLALREDEYTEKRCCYVAGCLGIANPCMKSVFE